MQKIRLWRDLGCISDVRASEKSSQRIKGVIDDSNGEGEESDSSGRSMVRVMSSIRSTGEIRLHLEFGSNSEVTVSAIVSLRFKVK